MREHKSRAFYAGMMVYGAARVRNALYWNNGDCFDLFAFKQENPAVLMDYIGLTDKNGKDIYECDVVKDDYNRVLLVEWRRCGFCFKAITKTNFVWACDIHQWFEYDDPRPEIIGNRYENPEMVEGI